VIKEKETVRAENEAPKKFTVKCLAENLAELNKLSLKTYIPPKKIFINGK
jgi:hypothetical protein